MTATIASAAVPYPAAQNELGAAPINALPASYLKQRTTQRRRVLPNIDCIQLDLPTVWDVSMPSELGGSTDDGSDREARQKSKKCHKATKFVNKTTNSWVSTNTTTTVVLPGAMVQFVNPYGSLQGSLPGGQDGLGESPYEDVQMNAPAQGYLTDAPATAMPARAVPRMAPPSTGVGAAAPPPSSTAAPPHGYGARAFSYGEAYGAGAVPYRPAHYYYPRDGSSRVEVLEDSVVPPQQRLSPSAHVPRGVSTPTQTPHQVEPRRSSLPVIAHSADRQPASAVPSAAARSSSYDGIDRRPRYHVAPYATGDAATSSQHSSQPGARLNGSQPVLSRQNNFINPLSDRVLLATTSAAAPAQRSTDAELLAGPRYYAELDQKGGYTLTTPKGGSGVEDLMFADEL